MCAKNKSNNTDQVTENRTERHVSEILAYFILVLCTLAIIYPPFLEVVSKSKQKIQIQIQTTDSIPSQALVVNGSDLDSLFCKIDEQEKRIKERYEYALEQRETEFKWQSYITFLIGIIVSICGFFGYKSIRDLKEDVHKDTKKWADRTARDIAEKTSTQTAKLTAEKTAAVTSKEIATRLANDVAQKISVHEVRKQLPLQVNEYLKSNLQKAVADQMEGVFKGYIYDALRTELMEYIDEKQKNAHRKRVKREEVEGEEGVRLPSEDNTDNMFQNNN